MRCVAEPDHARLGRNPTIWVANGTSTKCSLKCCSPQRTGYAVRKHRVHGFTPIFAAGAQVIPQVSSDSNQEFKHVIWDTWGGFVQTGFNVTYLVFDLNDSLANAATSQVPGRYGGIPCEVLSVVHLEKQWNAVSFYANENWVNCPPYRRPAPELVRMATESFCVKNVHVRGGNM